MGRPPHETPKQRFTVTLDAATVKTINRVQKTTPEVQGISAAIRYLARCHDSASKHKPRRAMTS